MAPTEALACPVCGEETTHRLVARTRLHIGIKRKWRCEDCEHQLVMINGTAQSASN